MNKFKFVAINKDRSFIENTLIEENIEKAKQKLLFELGYNEVLIIEEVFDIKLTLQKAKEKFDKLNQNSKQVNFDEINQRIKNNLNMLIKKINLKKQKKKEYVNQNNDNDFNLNDLVFTNSNFTEEDLIIDNIKDFSIDTIDISNEIEVEYKSLEVVKCKKVKGKILLTFFEKMTILLESDISIVKGIEIIRKNTKDKNFYKILTIIENDLNKGEKFSSSMGRFPNVFPKLFISLISAGEQSGALASVFKDITIFLTKQQKVERKIRTMSIYPMIVIFVLSLLLFGAGVYVEPKMEDMLSGFGVEIPFYAKIMFTIGRYIYAPYIVIFSYKFLKGFISRYLYKLHEKIENFFGEIWIKVPVIKNYIKAVSLFYYTNTIAIMLSNGLSVINSLEQGRESVGNSFIRNKLKNVSEDVSRGRKLSVIYKEIDLENILPEMVSIGEESGKLDRSFRNIAEYFNKNLETQIEVLTEFFQPATIILIGIILTPILLGVFLPLMKATSGGYM